MKVVAVLVVWLMVGLGSISAFLVFPFAWLVAERIVYAKNILRALDKTAAAFLGCSGEYTVSAECGVGSGWWAVLGRVVDALLGAGHCAEAAKREGLA